MLFKINNYRQAKGIFVPSLLVLLTSCSSGAALESYLSPDPKLTTAESRTTAEESVDSSAKPTIISDVNNGSSKQIEPLASEGKQPRKQPQGEIKSALPANFPASFPIYPQAQLKESKLGENKTSGMLTWNSIDQQQKIADYYEAELTAEGWTVIKPFNFNPLNQIARAIAVKEETRADLALKSFKSEQENKTQLSLIYRPIEEQVASQTKTKTKSDSVQSSSPSTKERSPIAKQPLKNKLETKTSSKTVIDGVTEFNSSGVEFDDLDRVPEQLRQPLESVAALDILTPYTGNNNVELSKFAPNAVVTRGEYARWLVDANNRYFQDDSGKKIYLVTTTSQPAFKDVQPSNPDFQAIQSLAEVGLIPSRLTEDTTQTLFKPNAPLKREDLLTWKVPLDMRDSLPKATIEAIEESWGFQDAADIDSEAIRALYGDYQNGDLANVRRIFGYTTLFQPKKPVTRAEGAASLAYFGFQGDGVTAKEVLAGESAQQN